MTDLEKFEKFFAEMGIAFSVREVKRRNEFKEKREPAFKRSMKTVSVTQCHFHFDIDDRYIGAEADEMGYFIPRENQ